MTFYPYSDWKLLGERNENKNKWNNNKKAYRCQQFLDVLNTDESKETNNNIKSHNCLMPRQRIIFSSLVDDECEIVDENKNNNNKKRSTTEHGLQNVNEKKRGCFFLPSSSCLAALFLSFGWCRCIRFRRRDSVLDDGVHKEIHQQTDPLGLVALHRESLVCKCLDKNK